MHTINRLEVVSAGHLNKYHAQEIFYGIAVCKLSLPIL